MNTLSAVSTPLLYNSQLKFRLGLAKKRLEHYPLDTMDFVMMDLERPALRTRHAHQCTYDLTGRTLLFYALAEGIEMVFVNGKLSYKDGALTGAAAGTLIR